jgi:subtilisin family serine protease
VSARLPRLIQIVGWLVVPSAHQSRLSLSGAADSGTGVRPLHRPHVPASMEFRHLAQELSTDPEITVAGPGGSISANTLPSDPLKDEQWGLARIQAPAAWEVITGTQAVVIADIGSGLDTSHPDLAGQLRVNPGEIAGNGLDDDSNGQVDDVHGWNVLADNADLSESTGHSTAVAGIMVAAKNEEGVTGVCWGCRLMVVKVTQPDGLACYSDIAEGITYAAQNGADVINISLRGHLDLASLRSALSTASQTAVVVSGAGNDSGDGPVYPAAYDTVLAVAGTNREDARLDESNHGSWVDVSAPGKDIVTTSIGGDYRTRSGTSVACAFASGLAGLLLSQHPEWTPEMVRAHLMGTTDGIDGLNPGLEGQSGTGRLNAASAVTEAVPP